MDINVRMTRGNSGKPRIQGDCVYQDTKFTFTVRKASKKPYTHNLQISVISPLDNKILQFGGRKLRNYVNTRQAELQKYQADIHGLSESDQQHQNLSTKIKRIEDKLETIKKGGRLDDLNCQTEVYLNGTKDTMIKKEVAVAVSRLCGEYQDDILDALKVSSSPENFHARTAYDMYQADFFNSQNAVSKKVLEGKQSTLKRVCDAINMEPIVDLTSKNIADVVKTLGKNPNQKLRLCESFLDFCGQNHVYRGTNPITVHFLSSGVKKGGNKQKAGNYPVQQSFLSPKVEKKLHEVIDSNIADNLSLAIPLVKGARLSMERLLTITWGELEIAGDEIRIQEYKDNFSGATLNYIHPPLAETTHFLFQKLKILQKIVSQRKLNKLKLVPIGGSKKEQKAILTKYFRDTLRQVGVNENDFKRASDVNNPKATGGAGYTLLCKHYDYVLQNRCGVDLSSGVGAYLRGMRINDVTTDSYRSLRDATGNHFLQTIVRRDQFFFSSGEVNPSIETEEAGGTTITTINPGDSPHLMGAISKPIFLPTGSKMVIEGDSGVMGTVSFSTSQAKRASSAYIKIF